MTDIKKTYQEDQQELDMLQRKIQNLERSLIDYQTRELAMNQKELNNWLIQSIMIIHQEVQKVKEGINQLGMALSSDQSEGIEQEDAEEKETEEQREAREYYEQAQRKQKEQSLPKSFQPPQQVRRVPLKELEDAANKKRYPPLPKEEVKKKEGFFSRLGRSSKNMGKEVKKSFDEMDVDGDFDGEEDIK